MIGRDWTDRYFNPWWGCQKISEGCRYCYAEVQSRIFKIGTGDLWSGKVRKMKDKNWDEPLLIHAKAKIRNEHALIACGSVCDWADPNASKFDRARFWGLVRDTKNVHWQLLTKRPIEASKFLPYDWGLGWENVSLGVSVENSQNLWKVGKLRSIPAKLKFVKFEPLLGPMCKDLDLTNIDWVLVGPETGKDARPIDLVEVENIRNKCQAEKIPFFFKGNLNGFKNQFPKKYSQIGVR